VSLPAPAERAALQRLLGDIQSAVEDLLLTGLATASAATSQTLSVSFEAASRLRLARLGVTLRVAVEELGRFARGDPGFSRRRFGFFLNRAWMLCQGLLGALQREDAERWQRLAGQAAARPLGAFEAVSLGVSRRVVPGAFAAFEFRLRGLSGAVVEGQPLIWSAVFPLKVGAEVPPEAYLHLPQAQGFKAALFLPGRSVKVSHAQVSAEGRLGLARDSRVEEAAAFVDWDRFLDWDPAAALSRVLQHRPGPFDLDVELQEEVVLRGFHSEVPEPDPREQQLRFPIVTPRGTWHATTGTGPEDAPLREALASWKKPQQTPLFGVMHYEGCRLLLQPLTLFEKDGPRALQLGSTSFDAAALVKALKFT
jgi:hypothetical protein